MVDQGSGAASFWAISRTLDGVYARERQSDIREPGMVSSMCFPDGDCTRALAANGVPIDGWVEALICEFDWPCAEAIAVARCESGLDPRAIGGANYGLFQIGAVHVKRLGGRPLVALLDAETNVAIAYAIFLDNAGWGPWSCKP